MKTIAFIDTEVSCETGKILDFGAVKTDGASMHEASGKMFCEFIKGVDFLCGHNVIRHDLIYLKKAAHIQDVLLPDNRNVIDTLVWSPLLFPQNPYHKLVKDDKLQSGEWNNPLNDAEKSKELFFDEIAAYRALPNPLQRIYYALLGTIEGYAAFFEYLDWEEQVFSAEFEINSFFWRRICANANIKEMAEKYPEALAYSLAIINAGCEDSVTPRWVLHQHPETDMILHRLRESPCPPGCEYCLEKLDARKALKRFFGYDAYRKFDGIPLQEMAVKAAIADQSLLAVFPTGGGKSITFQIPALLAGSHAGGLTVVISPLQSLMKDQVDNLEQNHITASVAINGLLDPIERADAMKRVEQGGVSLLYISPESLRNKSMERLLLGRRIVRFVIDEAHCFSAWGQDFRVEYQYIAEFISNLCEKKKMNKMIPVSCFTATAKPNVIEDIQTYFKENLNLELELYTANSARKNLTYKVIEKNERDKFGELRYLLDQKKCPTIIYVSRTQKANELTENLNKHGYFAKAYHGKMDKKKKSENQELFIRGEVDIMVATSAFGMGVDKKNVGMVIHYDISDSLENYSQEAGRAGRDQNISAECFILFNDEDLNNHFMLLNQTRIGIQEIQQVWKAIKNATGKRAKMSASALELARAAGWDDAIGDIENRVRTAVMALETAGYVKRRQNLPRVYADSILAKNAMEAMEKIRTSSVFQEKEEENAIRIIGKLISSRSRKNEPDEAESRVDYISDNLGIPKEQVLEIIQKLREIRVLSDAKDLTAYVEESDTLNRTMAKLRSFAELEGFLLQELPDSSAVLNLKEMNEHAELSELNLTGLNNIRIILNFWAVKEYIKREVKSYSRSYVQIELKYERHNLIEIMEKRWDISEFILQYLDKIRNGKDSILTFSVLELKESYEFEGQILSKTATVQQIEDALLFLSKIGSLKIEGGFLISYNALSIERIERDNKIRYKQEDYKNLKQYYEQKTQMIHIVGEYARIMLQDYEAALEFADDYFQMEYRGFLQKYFSGSKKDEIQKNLTPEKFKQLFGSLSPTQLKIINDQKSRFIVVAAGPGSGKTKILVHKLAALLMMEEVRQEQLLMLTFSRAAASEFKKRLVGLIGGAANRVQIQTFHSYCFDLLGKVGSLKGSQNVVDAAVQCMEQGRAEASKITKTVLVIDEAQDMSENEFRFIRTLIKNNDDMRVIAVGDDDQNIYAFRNSDSRYMRELLKMEHSCCYELVENYRSKKNLVEFTNLFAELIKCRMKETPNIAVQKENGMIQLTHYLREEFMRAVVSSLKRELPSGSVCVMTKTNEEAMQMYWLLEQAGIPARMIQSNESYSFLNLREIRFFIRKLNLQPDTYIIQDNTWNAAKDSMEWQFRRSWDMPVCVRLLNAFEELHTDKKYMSDFNVFLQESSISDFFENEQETVTVSTIHKSKGREFDCVVLCLKNYSIVNEEDKRTLYVGMTRAKERLMVHYNADFPGKKGDIRYRMMERIGYEEDEGIYAPSNKIMLQAGYRDIILSYFEKAQDKVQRVVSGDQLLVDEDGCLNLQGRRVLKFSKKMKEDIEGHIAKGYRLELARVNHVLFWQEEGKEKEIMIIHPEIELIAIPCKNRTFH